MTATTTTEPRLDEAPLTDAVRRLRDAEQAAATTRSRAAVAKEEVALTLFAITESFRDGSAALPLDTLDRLYWEMRDLRVVDIARAFGISQGQLTKLVRPRTESTPCPDCHRDVEVLRRTRSDMDPRRCLSCEQAARERAELARQQRELELAHVDHDERPPPGIYDDASSSVGYVGAYPAWDVPPPQHPDAICDVCHEPAGRGGW
ncbi:hypothetical protein [Egicoccus sp. AB-alg6-2]|uniref:hypothetical protein n=1 Tax=Egicoccus sp. AB-alg6-2 TaxID=3242692 RepID=UPI00359D98CB